MSMPSIIMVSFGNVPSRWAHTFNIMKMAEAMNELCSSFELVTQRHQLLKSNPPFDFKSHYGLNELFPIHYILRNDIPLKEEQDVVFDPKFNELAIDYASAKGCEILYTRSEHVANLACDKGMTTILETHIDRFNEAYPYVKQLSGNPHLLGLVTTNDYLKNELSLAGHPPSKILAKPNGVDTGRFNLPAKEVLREQVGWDGKPVVLYTGHLYEYKGIDMIISLAEKMPDIAFKIAGGWEGDIDKLQKIIDNKGLNNVDLMGFQPGGKLPELMKAADVLILPNSSKQDENETTSPLKLFSYLASGTPVLASDIPALRQIVISEYNAILAVPDNVDSFENGIRRIVKGGPDVQRIGDTAKLSATKFTWKDRAEEILNYFL